MTSMEEDYSSFTTSATSTNGFLHALLTLRTHIATTLFTSQVYYHLIEAIFFLLIIYLVFTRAYKPWTRNAAPTLSASEKAARLAAWKPDPLNDPPLNYNLVPNQQHQHLDIEIESDGSGPVAVVRGHGPVINLATHNFLGLLKDKRVEEEALSVMRDYGCGACGPRGFYGTTEVHLECEAALARFCGTDTAILYSFGAATASSTIPAFVKRGDLLVVDDAISYPIRAGVRLSRARVVPFRHNDMDDLRRVLERSVVHDDNRRGKKGSVGSETQQRRLIIVEGISSTCGDICPLDTVVKLKDEFKFRLLIDESLSFGVLGASGRGALQEFNVDRNDVEFATADLGNALATVGGFCVGRDDVVDHQRLSGAGYCFSASQPPFLAKAATTGLQLLTDDGASLVNRLRDRVKVFHDTLPKQELRAAGWHFADDVKSPVIFFHRTQDDDDDDDDDDHHHHHHHHHMDLNAFTMVHRQCLERGVLVPPPLAPPDDPLASAVATDAKKKNKKGGSDGNSDSKRKSQLSWAYQRPALRVSVSAAHSEEQIRTAAEVIGQALLNATGHKGRQTESASASIPT